MRFAFRSMSKLEIVMRAVLIHDEEQTSFEILV